MRLTHAPRFRSLRHGLLSSAVALTVLGLALHLSVVASPREVWPRVADIEVPKSDIKLSAPKVGETSIDSSRIEGVLVGDLNVVDVPSEFVVYGVRPEDSGYCVEVARANNLFTATFEFKGKPQVDVYRVKLDIPRWSDQRPVRSGELSIQVRAKSRGSCMGPLLPARWGRQLDATDGSILYNGGQSSTAYVQVGQSSSAECRRLAGDVLPSSVQSVAYNFVCPIHFLPSNCGHDNEIVVLRETGGLTHGDADRAHVRPICRGK